MNYTKVLVRKLESLDVLVRVRYHGTHSGMMMGNPIPNVVRYGTVGVTKKVKKYIRT